MEFDHHLWTHHPEQRWLVKCSDRRVHAGAIAALSTDMVVVKDDAGSEHLALATVEWIRPLITTAAEGWIVLAGFQAEDTTFETWWRRGDVLLAIDYSDPSGFSDLDHVIASPEPSLVVPPSPEARAMARAAIHRFLVEHRPVAVPPIAHLQ